MNLKLTGVLVAGAALATAGHAQNYVNTVLSTDPSAYWRMDNVNENDIVGGYSTNYSGDTTVTGPGGGIPLADDPNNAAASFDGNGYIQTNLTNQVSFGQAATVMAWINMAELPSVANQYFYIAGQSDYGNDLDLQVQNDNQLYFYTDSGGHTNTTVALQANQWYQVVGTIDNATNTRNLYVNGVLVGSTSGVATHYADSNAFDIGASDVFGGRNFDGLIDEVTVWNYALSGDQVSNIYNSAVAAPEPCSLLVLGGVSLVALRRRKK